DRNIALRVSETDRGGDVEHTLAAGLSAYPASRRRSVFDEVPKQQVDLDRIAQVWCVPRALEHNQLTAGVRGEGDPAGQIGHPVAVAVHDQDRAADTPSELERLVGFQVRPQVRQAERLARRFQGPANAVFDRL